MIADEIETRWQDFWEEYGTFRAQPDRAAGRSPAPPSWRGEAVRPGHVPLPVRGRSARRAPAGLHRHGLLGRYQRMPGATCCTRWASTRSGCRPSSTPCRPAQHPRLTTEAQHRAVPGQLRRLGLAYDDRRSVATTDMAYYRWTQWIFLQIFNSWYDPEQQQGPADRRADRVVQAGKRPTPDGRPWSRTVRRGAAPDRRRPPAGLRQRGAGELVPGPGHGAGQRGGHLRGRSERGNFPVFKRRLKQWMMRITAYADRLLEDLDQLDWPEPSS